MQLELFALPSQKPINSPLWEHLSPEKQKALISALAQLMKKALRPEERRSPDER